MNTPPHGKIMKLPPENKREKIKKHASETHLFVSFFLCPHIPSSSKHRLFFPSRLCPARLFSLGWEKKLLVSTSSPPYTAHAPDTLPTHRAYLHLPRTLLARDHVPAVVEQRVHLILVAYLTRRHLLVRHLVRHHTLAVPSSLLPSALVHVVRFAVDHLASAVLFVLDKVAHVGVTGRISHGPLTGSLVEDPISNVRVAVGGDHCALAMADAERDRTGTVRLAKVVVCSVRGKITRIVVIAQIGEITDGVRMFPLIDQSGGSVLELVLIPAA